jgi:hypothetical protein
VLTILGIHGVGSQVKGSVRSAIAVAVTEAGYEAQSDEVYWSDEVDLRSAEDIFLLANGMRTNGAMLSVASEGFLYFKFRTSSTAGCIFQLIDSAVFVVFHILFLLIPIAVGSAPQKYPHQK